MDLLKNKFNQQYIGNEDEGSRAEEQKPKNAEIYPPIAEEKKADINKYKDPEGLTVGRMSFGLWIVANRRNFKIILVVFLSLIAVYCWGVFVFTFGHLVIFGIKQDHALLSGLINSPLPTYSDMQATAAKELQYGQIGFLQNAEGHYDFYVKVSNPNDRYWAHFNYYFISNGQETGSESGFILPGESKYLLLMNKDMDTLPSSLRFALKDVNWQRVDWSTYGDWSEFAKSHLAISVGDINFTPAQSSSLSEQININVLDFSTKNNTAYNYWDVAYNVLLLNGNNIIGVNRYTSTRLMSGATQQISITWPEDLKNVTDIAIYPEVDITRSDVYIDFNGGTGQEK